MAVEFSDRFPNTQSRDSRFRSCGDYATVFLAAHYQTGNLIEETGT
jgi:hypothetical protein